MDPSSPRVFPSPRRALPLELKAFLWTSLAGWLLSLAYLFRQIRHNPLPHHGLPYDLYTRAPFEDTFAYVTKLNIIHQPAFFTSGWPYLYPAPAVFVYKFLRLFAFPLHGSPFMGCALALCFFTMIGTLIGAARLYRALIEHTPKCGALLFLAASVAMSWPIFYAMHQGNIEALLWLGVAVGVWAVFRKRWTTAAIWLALFASAKIYPVLYFATFLRAKRYKEIALGVLIFTSVTLASLAYIGPSIRTAYAEVSKGIAYFNHIGLSAGGVVGDSRPFDHSLCGLIHMVLAQRPFLKAVVLLLYMPLAGVLLLTLYFARLWKMPTVNQVLFISVAAVLIPTTSFDYTLQLLYIPWAWLALETVAAASNGIRLKGMFAAMVALGIVLAPTFYAHRHGHDYWGQLKAVVLTFLLALSAIFSLAQPTSPRAAEQ